MHRTTTITQILLPVETAAGFPGGQHITATQIVTVLDAAGNPVTSQHNNLPMIGEDFTPVVLATINARLTPLGLSLTTLAA